MAKLGLNAAHEHFIVEYLQVAKYKRAQCLKDVESAFNDLAESRLIEETFTGDEVKEMLDGLCGVLKADLSSELMHNSHTSTLLLLQMFQQAEKWHLKLQLDLSEMESGELLEKIAHFEQENLSSLATPLHKKQLLEPINSAGGDKLLKLEIERLEEENTKLKSRIRVLEEKAISALSAKDRLQEDILARQMSVEESTDSEHSQLQQQISMLQLQLSKVKSEQSSVGEAEDLRKELASTSHKLLEVTAELEETKKNLERKFNETPQYNNMKKMLTSKNKNISDLRAQLQSLETQLESRNVR